MLKPMQRAAESHEPRLLRLARRIQALAQTGLTYAEGPYDRERYAELQDLAAELMAMQCDTPLTVIHGLFSSQTGYATPKVDVRAGVFREGQVLLVQEDEDACWTLPGGWADVNESPSQAACREVREEAGLEVQAVKLAMLLDRSMHPHQPPFPFHVYKLFFVCRAVAGEPRPGPGLRAAAFFALDRLPPLSLTRVLPGQIHRLYEHVCQPALPTDYD
ncbi:MAG: NUDIX hydrolase [Verrucomicrobiota bacterium]|nr:NUDIX hydrolase [Limisphaera sp.]MDW8381773.1 NUDIX hydrolase [Verrucomicrobiota bacterium]